MAIISVTKDRYTITDPLYQWDLNQVLYIYGLSVPSAPEIHFTNETMDRAIVRQAVVDSAGVISVEIPNSLLQKPYKITTYVCLYDGDTFESQYSMILPVTARKKPSDYTIEDTDVEIYSFNALENKVDNALIELNNASAELRSATENMETEIATQYDKAVEALTKVVEEEIGKLDPDIAVLGDLATKDSIDLSTDEATGVLSVEKGGTGSSNALGALHALGILQEAITTAPSSLGQAFGFVKYHPLFTEGMSTYEFIDALPANSIVSFSAGLPETDIFSDAPTSYGEYLIIKGISSYYTTGFCVTANADSAKIYYYSVKGTSGKWVKIMTANDFVYSDGTLTITTT